MVFIILYENPKFWGFHKLKITGRLLSNSYIYPVTFIYFDYDQNLMDFTISFDYNQNFRVFPFVKFS